MSKIQWIRNTNNNNGYYGFIKGSSLQFEVERDEDKWRLVCPPNAEQPTGLIVKEDRTAMLKLVADSWFMRYSKYFLD